MRIWIRAVGIACVVEVVVVTPLALAIWWPMRTNGKCLISLVNFTTVYHMLSLTLTFTLSKLLELRTGRGHESVPFALALFVCLVYLFQVILMTPIIFLFLKWVGHVRGHRKGVEVVK
jgi:hypothetical protein